MIKWIEATGKNEAAAIASALAQLSLDRDDVSVEVLERAKSGFLGIGSSPARVKVSYEVPDEPKASPKVTPPVETKVVPVEPLTPEPEKPVKEPKPKQAPAQAAAPKESAPVQAVASAAQEVKEVPPAGEIEPKIVAFLSGLLKEMDVVAQPVVERRESGAYEVVLEGESLGALIGHRGETLDAIQQLTNYAVNRDRQKRVRIHIDVENYRQKREDSLKRLANKVAAKVVKYHRNITLEPMNAYERHVIHETLQDYPDVVTYSTGTEPYRRTVVAFTKGKHTY